MENTLSKLIQNLNNPFARERALKSLIDKLITYQIVQVNELTIQQETELATHLLQWFNSAQVSCIVEVLQITQYLCKHSESFSITCIQMGAILFFQTLRIYIPLEFYNFIDEILNILLMFRSEKVEAQELKQHLQKKEESTKIVLSEQKETPQTVSSQQSTISTSITAPSLATQFMPRKLLNLLTQGVITFSNYKTFEFSDKEKQILLETTVKLQQNNVPIILDGLNLLKYSILYDFPPEIFFIFSDVVRSLISLFYFSNQGIKDSSTFHTILDKVFGCLHILVQQLISSKALPIFEVFSEYLEDFLSTTFYILNNAIVLLKTEVLIPKVAYLLHSYLPILETILSNLDQVQSDSMQTKIKEQFLVFFGGMFDVVSLYNKNHSFGKSPETVCLLEVLLQIVVLFHSNTRIKVSNNLFQLLSDIMENLVEVCSWFSTISIKSKLLFPSIVQHQQLSELDPSMSASTWVAKKLNLIRDAKSHKEFLSHCTHLYTICLFGSEYLLSLVASNWINQFSSFLKIMPTSKADYDVLESILNLFILVLRNRMISKTAMVTLDTFVSEELLMMLQVSSKPLEDALDLQKVNLVEKMLLLILEYVTICEEKSTLESLYRVINKSLLSTVLIYASQTKYIGLHRLSLQVLAMVLNIKTLFEAQDSTHSQQLKLVVEFIATQLSNQHSYHHSHSHKLVVLLLCQIASIYGNSKFTFAVLQPTHLLHLMQAEDSFYLTSCFHILSFYLDNPIHYDKIVARKSDLLEVILRKALDENGVMEVREKSLRCLNSILSISFEIPLDITLVVDNKNRFFAIFEESKASMELLDALITFLMTLFKSHCILPTDFSFWNDHSLMNFTKILQRIDLLDLTAQISLCVELTEFLSTILLELGVQGHTISNTSDTSVLFCFLDSMCQNLQQETPIVLRYGIVKVFLVLFSILQQSTWETILDDRASTLSLSFDISHHGDVVLGDELCGGLIHLFVDHYKSNKFFTNESPTFELSFLIGNCFINLFKLSSVARNTVAKFNLVDELLVKVKELISVLTISGEGLNGFLFKNSSSTNNEHYWKYLISMLRLIRSCSNTESVKLMLLHSGSFALISKLISTFKDNNQLQTEILLLLLGMSVQGDDDYEKALMHELKQNQIISYLMDLLKTNNTDIACFSMICRILTQVTYLEECRSIMTKHNLITMLLEKLEKSYATSWIKSLSILKLLGQATLFDSISQAIFKDKNRFEAIEDQWHHIGTIRNQFTDQQLYNQLVECYTYIIRNLCFVKLFKQHLLQRSKLIPSLLTMLSNTENTLSLRCYCCSAIWSLLYGDVKHRVLLKKQVPQIVVQCKEVQHNFQLESTMYSQQEQEYILVQSLQSSLHHVLALLQQE